MTRIGVLAGKVLLNPGILKKKIIQVRPSAVLTATNEVIAQYKYGKIPVSETMKFLEECGAIVGDKQTKRTKDILLHCLEPDIYSALPNTKPLTKKSTFGQFLKRINDYVKAEIEHKKAVQKARDNF